MNSILPLLRSALMPLAPWRTFVLVTALASVAVTGSACAQNTDPVVARVNGAEIRSSDLAIAEEEVGSNMPAMSPEAKRDYLVTYVSDMILAAKAAEDKKLTEDDGFKRRLAYLRNKLLMETMLHAEAKTAVNDAAMHKVYDEAAKQMAGEKEVRARHILVETEDEAKALVDELKKGTDFAELARLKSKDPGAASEGGDLGYFTKDQMVPEFAETAFKLDKGQLSDPIKTQFGWHVIKVEDKRDRPVPSFEQVKDQIETYVVRRAQAEAISKLRQGAKIERADTKGAAPAPAPAPAPEKKN
ncbi:MAG TPA: peptidylprolyl isomerase [Xanthobacteraceae bacterium]|nr:peptidylprolyl isomerase [Xanthobacteraceae bacterium]